MSVVYNAFDKQSEVHNSDAPIKFVFAGKRGAKTWCAAIETILHLQNKPNYDGKDVYKCAIAAPTFDMLRRLSMNQFYHFGKPYILEFNKSRQEAIWCDGSIIYGLSADRPQRAEGLKLNFAWLDEALQCSEQFFLEMLARLSDSRGHLLLTSSLGVQYTNPKKTWCYQYAYVKPLPGTEVFEWSSVDNPHLPQDELLKLKDSLDPRTYRQMFEVDWNIPGTNLVFDDFDEGNLRKAITIDRSWEISVTVDWGWAHEMAAVFTAYDQRSNTVYVIDEIVKSRLKREELYDLIRAKGYRITNWYCDISGTKDTEAQSMSNVRWFREHPRNIHFKYRSSAVQLGVSFMRNYVKSGDGSRRLIIDELRCPKLVDQIMNYHYPTDKAGQILNENPVKKDDDAIDALRYYFVNRLLNKDVKQIETFQRFGTWRI